MVQCLQGFPTNAGIAYLHHFVPVKLCFQGQSCLASAHTNLAFLKSSYVEENLTFPLEGL